MTYRVLVIGSSAGGFKALHFVLSRLPENFPMPVLIVIHIPANETGRLATHLDRISSLPVHQAWDKMEPKAGMVYLAPANYHLLMEYDGWLALDVAEPVNYSRPSIDVLFQSVARVRGNQVIGLLMTGANDDGARGLHEIARNGGFTIVEDPASAEYKEMPQSALKRFAPDFVVHLDEIPRLLCEQVGVEGVHE